MKTNLNECKTRWGAFKKKYDTLDEAIKKAKQINELPQTITKKVAYKCKICYKYHIGSNGKTLQKN